MIEALTLWYKVSSMPRIAKANRVALLVMCALSLLALVTVVSGYFQPPQPDEGTAAHLFQLAIVALVPALLAFLLTGDWQSPLRTLRLLLLPALVLVTAFGALYYLERLR